MANYSRRQATEKYERVKTICSIIISVVGLLISIISLELTSTYKLHEKRLSKPMIDVSCEYDSKYNQIEKLFINSSGMNIGTINVKIFPYLSIRLFTETPRQEMYVDASTSFAEGELNFIAESSIAQKAGANVDYYYQLEKQFYIPIESKVPVFTVVREAAKSGTIASVSYNNALPFIDNLVGFSEYYQNTRSRKYDHVVCSIEYFLVLDYQDLDNEQYTDIYQCITGFGDNCTSQADVRYVAKQRDPEDYELYSNILDMFHHPDETLYYVGMTVAHGSVQYQYSTKRLILNQSDNKDELKTKVNNVILLFDILVE